MKSSVNSRMQASIQPTHSGELFNLKVMRFPQPHVTVAQSVVHRQHDGILLAEYKAKPGDTYGRPEAVSTSLSLVSDNKSVYLGENTTMSVVITQNSEYTVSSVGIRLEVQTQKSRQILVDSLEDPKDLKAGQSLDYLFSFRLSEPGENALVCCLFYVDDGQAKNIQKFFRFVVDEPFRVDSKVLGNKECMFTQVTLANRCENPLLIKSLQLVTPPVFDIKSLNQAQRLHLINPQAVHSFAFKLTRNQSEQDEKEIGNLGHLKIIWRRAGHLGVLETRPLPAPSFDISASRCSVKVIESPACVELEKFFKVTIEVECHSVRPLHLRLHMDSHKHLSIVPGGLSNISCGLMKRGQKKRVSLPLLPLALGVQKLAGIKVTCKEVGYSEDFDNLHQVCVMKTPISM